MPAFYTRTPWHSDDNGEFGPTIKSDQGHNIMLKGELCGSQLDRINHARLLAAAPELYEACLAATGVYEALRLCGVATQLPGFESCLRDLEAAIAKAEGASK